MICYRYLSVETLIRESALVAGRDVDTDLSMIWTRRRAGGFLSIAMLIPTAGTAATISALAC